ncbi:MAG: hypothetical protein JWN17_1108 [Frankiales bacterium]|nr:hypothetical protein [Frankiales bacterium]
MRITDVALSTATPISNGPRTKRTEADSTAPTLLASAKTESAPHPDEVAATKLQRAAAHAQAARVVSAENQRASASARGEIDPGRVLQSA